MNIRSFGCDTRLFSVAFALILAIAFAGIAGAQERDRIGKVQQGLVGGTTVSAELQEQYGLVTLSTGCSGSLLRNNWVITAAHCIDDPDPANPGQFITVPENSVSLTGNWKRGDQVRQSARIISFRPNDVAIIRFTDPFNNQFANEGYNRDLYRDSLKSVSIMAFGRGINQLAQGSGGSAMPSQRDGQYRVGYFSTDTESDISYDFPTGGQTIAGGDSGGPSFVKTASGELLAGVHSSCEFTCMPGRMCAPPAVWSWVIATPRCTDASIAPLWDEINRYLGAFVAPAPFIGTFGTTPPNYQPMWVYAIKNDGDLLWYRKDTGTASWQGPKKVGNGWNFKDVIPAGGNSIYALTDDGNLLWYQHTGFNDGSFTWNGPVNVGRGWTFTKIFSGGEGIVYALQPDGTLLWYRHGGYADGGGPNTWTGPKAVGSGWQNFKDIFSLGEGKVYAVKPDGTLLFYQQIGWQTGERSWKEARQVGTAAAPISICDAARAARARNSPAAPGLEARCRAVGEMPTAAAPAQPTDGWQNFRQIVPAGDGVILAIKADGKLLWYRHREAPAARQPDPGYRALGRVRSEWQGPIEIGAGWQGFKKVIALMPVASAPVVR